MQLFYCKNTKKSLKVSGRKCVRIFSDSSAGKVLLNLLEKELQAFLLRFSTTGAFCTDNVAGYSPESACVPHACGFFRVGVPCAVTIPYRPAVACALEVAGLFPLLALLW